VRLGRDFSWCDLLREAADRFIASDGDFVHIPQAVNAC
jgi:hypothetical protein